jgi:molecular chaperone DnaJ
LKKKDKSYYQILGLEPGASASDIKRAYRKIAKALHPDLGLQQKSEEERARQTEEMLRVNEAYETLFDKCKRADYDAVINPGALIRQPFKFARNTEDEAREAFLARIFNPSRSAVGKVLQAYKKQVRRLSLDPFDDGLVAEFEIYLSEVEDALSRASDLFSSQAAPSSLVPAVQNMRHCIAQASDGLDELHQFCRNYNYDHLSMAESLFKIALDLSKKAFDLTKIA